MLPTPGIKSQRVHTKTSQQKCPLKLLKKINKKTAFDKPKIMILHSPLWFSVFLKLKDAS